MNRRNILAIAATVIGLAVIPVAAQKSQRAAGNMHERFFSHVATALSLTDSQKAAAQQLFDTTKSQAEPLMEQMKQNRADMQAAIKANNTGQISTVAARQGQLSAQLAELHGKAMAAFYAQLTPDQKAKADGMLGHFEAAAGQRHFGAMRGHHGFGSARQLDAQQQ